MQINNVLNKIFGIFFRGDKVVWIIFLLLCFTSVLVVFSATSTIAYKYSNHWTPIVGHFSKLIIGLMVVMVLQQMSPKYFRFASFGVILGAILLIYTMFKGVTTNSASRWISLGFFQFQPSELAKLMLVCYFAFLLSKINEKNVKQIFYILLSTLSIVCILILIDNFSTALLLGCVCFLMMFIGQIPVKYLLTVLAGVALVVGLFFFIITLLPSDNMDGLGRLGTWKARIERFGKHKEELNAETYIITDKNRQETHAKIAIAQGGIAGMPGSGNQRDYLPQAYSDFIFAIILEEMGILGGLFVMALYIILLFRCGIIAKKTENKFYKYLIIGSALIVVVQAMVNMSVAVGIIPVTGQPLPLLSRGGTSMIITCAYFGIILSCSSKQNSEQKDAIDSNQEPDLGIVENND